MINLKSPICIVWEITSNCNLFCPHCRTFKKNINYHKYENSIELENKIIREIIKNNILFVNLSGGEPLLHPRIEYFTKIFSDNNIEIGISTNGLLFEKYAENLVKNGLKFIQISVDGPENIHDSFRGLKGSYNKAVSSIKLAKSLGVRTQMNVTITSENINTLFFNVELGKKIGVDKVFFRRFVPTGKGSKNTYLIPQKKEFLKQLENLVNINEDSITVSIDDPLAILFKKDKKHSSNYLSCGAGITSLGIDCLGNLFPCIFLREKIGNILNAGISKTWSESSILINIRNREVDGCKDCEYRFECGGCRAFSGVFKVDTMCPYIK